MTATLGDVFRLAERTARNSRTAMLDAMEELRSVTGQAWTPSEKYRGLSPLSSAWKASSGFVVPWAVMSWKAMTDATPDVTLILRLHSRVWSMEPMLVAAIPVRHRPEGADVGYYLEEDLQKGRAAYRPVVSGDDRLVEVLPVHKKTHLAWHAFAVSLALLTSSEALVREVVTPLAGLVAGDPQGTLDALSDDDEARVGFGPGVQAEEDDSDDAVEEP